MVTLEVFVTETCSSSTLVLRLTLYSPTASIGKTTLPLEAAVGFANTTLLFLSYTVMLTEVAFCDVIATTEFDS